jgi:hypothetical protein
MRALVLVAVTACVLATGAPTAARVILHVVTPASVTSDTITGLRAALYELNTTAINVTIHDVSNRSQAQVKSLVDQLQADPDVFGFLLPHWRVSDYVIESSLAMPPERRKPIVAPRTSAISVPFSSETSRHVVHVRPPLSAEVTALLSYAVHAGLHCTSFAMVAYDESDIAVMLAHELSYYLASFSMDSLPAVWYHDKSSLQHYFFGNSSAARRTHTCAALLGDANQVMEMITALQEDARFDWENTYFLAMSVSNAPHFASAPSFNKLFITQTFPNPIDSVSSSALTVAFQGAMARYFQSIGEVLLPQNLTYGSIEAYTSARMLAEALRPFSGRTSSVTPSQLLVELYKRKFIAVEDFLMGPLSDGCPPSITVRQSQTLPCFCNVASGSTMFMSKVDGTTGLLISVLDDINRGEMDTNFSRKSPAECEFSSAIYYPINILCVADRSVSGPAEMQQVDFIFTLAVGAVYANNNQIMDAYGRFRPILTILDVNNITEVEASVSRYAPAVVVGSATVPTADTRLRLQRNFTAIPLVDAPLFASNVVVMDAAVADYIHALAAFATSSGSPQRKYRGPVTVVGESDRQTELAEQSLHTFQVEVDRRLLFSDPLWPSVLNASLRVSGAIVLAVAQSFATVEAFLRNISSLPNLRSGQAEAGEVETFIGIACDLQLLWQFQDVEHFVFAPQHYHVYYASSQPDPHAAAHPLQSIQEFSGAIITGGTNSSGLYSPAIVGGFMDALFMLALVQASQTSQALTRVTTTLYSMRVVSTSVGTYGPFFDAKCSDEARSTTMRTCECNKAVREFYVRNVTEYLLHLVPSGSSAAFSYIHPGCGVTYAPLQRGDSGLPITLLISGTITIVVCFMLALLLGRVVRTAQFARFIKTGMWLLVLGLAVRCCFIVLKIFSVVMVTTDGSAVLVFRLLYGFVTVVSILAGIFDTIVQIRHFMVTLEFATSEDMPAEQQAVWNTRLAKSSLMTLGAEDLPLLVMTFVALLLQTKTSSSSTVPLLVTLSVTSFFAGNKQEMVKREVVAVIKKMFTTSPRTAATAVAAVALMSHDAQNLRRQQQDTATKPIANPLIVDEDRSEAQHGASAASADSCGTKAVDETTAPLRHGASGRHSGQESGESVELTPVEAANM